jgi:hypothetical protein
VRCWSAIRGTGRVRDRKLWVIAALWLAEARIGAKDGRDGMHKLEAYHSQARIMVPFSIFTPRNSESFSHW